MEKIEEIMKPYFDKEQEINNTNKIDPETKEQINILKLRLERLQEQKNQEIEEYLNQAQLSNNNFYSGYTSMIKKDLEQAYKTKEEELQKEIEKLSHVESPSLEKTMQNKREMIDIQTDVRRKLYQEKNKLEDELSEQKIKFDMLMLEMSRFKYEYNDQNQVINGNQFRTLWEKNDQISNRITEIRNSLNKIEEYLKVTEYKENIVVKEEETVKLENEDNTLTEEVEQLNIPKEVIEDDMISNEDPVNYSYELDKNNNKVFENYQDLVKYIYNDVVSTAQNVQGVELNSSKKSLKENERYFSTSQDSQKFDVDGGISVEGTTLPNGQYINADDIMDATQKYIEENKGRTFVVKTVKGEENNQVVQFANDGLNKLKTAVKKCSAIKLLIDKKLSSIDLKRVFKKEEVEEMEKDLGSVETNIKDGEYINRNELISNLTQLFETKKMSWLKDLSNKLKSTTQEKKEQLNEKNDLEKWSFIK